jgi:class 3 adenylate cyclase
MLAASHGHERGGAMTERRSGSSPALSRIIRVAYPLRILGWALGGAMFITILYPRQSSLLEWATTLTWAFLWPHVAVLHSRFAKRPWQAERANFVIEGAGYGACAAALSFSLVPSAVLLFNAVINAVGIGGRSLATRVSLMFVAGGMAIGTVLGFRFVPGVSTAAAFVSLLVLAGCVIPSVATLYRITHRAMQLRNYLPRRVAALVMHQGDDRLLRPRRLKVTVCAIDLRGFTAFADSADPEEVMALLSEYYALVGNAIEDHDGTVERFTGDGMIAFFNAPLELPNPEECAVRASLRIQHEFRSLRENWRLKGPALGLGIGISSGHASAGAIGFRDQRQYAAIGPVTNLSARLCGMAAHGEVLVTSHVLEPLAGGVAYEARGEQEIRGLSRRVPVFNVSAMTQT